MPSIRIKRGNYTTLHEFPTQQSHQGRPRSRTLADIYEANARPQSTATSDAPQDTPLTEARLSSQRPTTTRQRSQTVAAYGSPHTITASPVEEQLPYADGNSPVTARPRAHTMMRRPPSKVSSMIFSNRRTPGLKSLQGSLQSGDRTESDAGAHMLPSPDRKKPIHVPRHSHEDRADMISVQGSQADIIYPTDGHDQPGRLGSALSLPSHDEHDEHNTWERQLHHHDDIVEHLDVIDPQVATVSMLTNAANAIVFPPLSFYSRKPVIVLPSSPPVPSDAEQGSSYEDNLDRHVEHVLRRKEMKDKWDHFRRVMKGVWSFMKTPMGIIVTFYGFNVVFWGAGIVFFLGKLYDFHNANTQGFWVEVCQQVETGLFTATSIGLIPFRVLDTWRMSRIYHYQRITIKRRQQAGLPDLYDIDDLPDPLYDENCVLVLNETEQADLHYQQHKFMLSQTWYRPHGTFTHRAFPISLALWICIMNGLNSFFQCLLSGCMWSMNRFRRPAWTTATTLPAAFIAGILAAVFIWWGGKKTRRQEEVVKRLRAALAMDGDLAGAVAEEDTEKGANNGHTGSGAEGGESNGALPKAEFSENNGYTMREKDVGEQNTVTGHSPTLGGDTPTLGLQGKQSGLGVSGYSTPTLVGKTPATRSKDFVKGRCMDVSEDAEGADSVDGETEDVESEIEPHMRRRREDESEDEDIREEQEPQPQLPRRETVPISEKMTVPPAHAL